MANTIKKILEYFSENADCSDDEVQLFRKFGKGITNYTNAVYVAETHGAHKANVEFKSQVHYVPTRCEIADLLLIAVDPLNGIRATFLQVKKRTGHRGYKWVSLSNHSPLPMFDFKGQFNQWELLATLRKIRGVGKFHPPKDLLSGASSCAIGSFGVFYCDNSNKVDMLYSIAKYISASTKGGNNVKGHTHACWLTLCFVTCTHNLMVVFLLLQRSVCQSFYFNYSEAVLVHQFVSQPI